MWKHPLASFRGRQVIHMEVIQVVQLVHSIHSCTVFQVYHNLLTEHRNVSSDRVVHRILQIKDGRAIKQVPNKIPIREISISRFCYADRSYY